MLRVPLPGVFKPRSDSRMLADHIGRERLVARARVLDVCTGSGVLAIAAARAGASRVTAVDVSRRAVLAAWLNAWLNGVRLRVRRGDLFEPVRGERFDLIVSNPPYIPSEDDELPGRGPRRALDAGPNGRFFLDRICSSAPEYLTPGGAVLLVHSSICSEQATLDALRRGGLEGTIVSRRRGALGPVVSHRASMLRARGLLGDDPTEEIVIARGVLLPASGPRALSV
jgi:release factor glutamine methyltransferase